MPRKPRMMIPRGSSGRVPKLPMLDCLGAIFAASHFSESQPGTLLSTCPIIVSRRSFFVTFFFCKFICAVMNSSLEIVAGFPGYKIWLSLIISSTHSSFVFIVGLLEAVIVALAHGFAFLLGPLLSLCCQHQT